MAEDWPSPHHHEAHALPRIEDLPVAAEGYDRERVQAAFDAFYRHIAQLDSTLRTLESVDVFKQQAGDLRAELRSIRAAGWAPYPRGYTLAPERSLFSSVPDAVPRIALEVVFLIVVAAVVAVAKFTSLEIVGVMAGAVAIVFLVELIAARDRRTGTPIPAAPPARPARAREEAPVAPPRPAAVSATAAEPDETEEPVATGKRALVAEDEEPGAADDGSGWAAFAEPAGPQPLVLMGALALDEEEPESGEPRAKADEPAAERAPEPEPDADAESKPAEAAEGEPVARAEPAPELEPIPEPEPGPDLQPAADAAEAETGVIAKRGRSRRRRSEEPPHEAAPAPHVRVLPPSKTALAEPDLPPWERGFDDTEERR
jgi:hypothetical protein